MPCRKGIGWLRTRLAEQSVCVIAPLTELICNKVGVPVGDEQRSPTEVGLPNILVEALLDVVATLLLGQYERHWPLS